MLKIWYYLNYEGRSCLCVQPKTNAILDVCHPFRSFKDSQSCNMLELGVERCSSVSPVCRYVLTINNVKVLHKCEETSLTVRIIAVSFTFSEKWPQLQNVSRKFQIPG